MILTLLQKLPNNVGNLGKISVATGFEWLPKVQKTPNMVTLLLRRNRFNLVLCSLTSCYSQNTTIPYVGDFYAFGWGTGTRVGIVLYFNDLGTKFQHFPCCSPKLS